MVRGNRALRLAVLSLWLVGVGIGQEAELERARNEAARLREMTPAPDPDFSKNLKQLRERSADFQAAIRGWIESMLPQTRSALDAEFPFLNARLSGGLQRAGLLGAEQPMQDFNPGYVYGLSVSRPAEAPDKLVAIAGAGLPCGHTDAVYVYDYSSDRPRRILDSSGSRDHDESIDRVIFSKPDAAGTLTILTLRFAVQCGSSWNGLAYDLFRLPAKAEAATEIFSGEHDIWFGGGHAQVRLNSDDLLIEMRDRSIDAGVHNRTHVLHFKLGGDAVERIDPVALQPQDFADEWLTRPWAEMESRSASPDREKLKKWHDFLSGDFVAGEYTLVQECTERPGQWQVGIDFNFVGGKEMPEPLSTYFLIRQVEQYRFEMEEIGFARQDGCPGKGQASTESPSLFPKEP